jgi:Holliday junction resolvase RusA-like endonuclease
MADEFKYDGLPIAKPRMVASDRYKRRPTVERYWAFKDKIIISAKQQKFKLGEAYKVTFIMPMPKSMSLKKKALLNGTPHKSRPDLDNMLKSLNDCLMDEDSFVHYVTAIKKWGYEGKIIVENFPENLEFS